MAPEGDIAVVVLGDTEVGIEVVPHKVADWMAAPTVPALGRCHRI